MENAPKILVTGADGQLGSALKAELGACAIFTGRRELDICNRAAVHDFIGRHRPELIINCAAYTAVDKAESDAEACAAINVEGVRNLASASADTGARIIHVSTDYVFDGKSCRPYVESDVPAPCSVYGSTKLEGERVLMETLPDSIIVRTGWLYSRDGHCFLNTMLSLARSGKALRVVSDQAGTPTFAADLARALTAIATSGQWMPGVYHFANEGIASWYDFAMAIFDEASLEPDVTPVPTAAYPTAARRPQYSVLDKSKIKTTFGLRIAHWREALRRCMKEKTI